VSDESATDWLIVTGAGVATATIAATLVFCLCGLRQADDANSQRKWRNRSILAGVTALLWTIHMIWALIDWGSHPFNR
jgi:hypothetical protein